MERTKEQEADSLLDFCRMFGIDPPRPVVQADVMKIYRRMPTVGEAIWKANFAGQAELITQADLDAAVERNGEVIR